MGQPIKIAAANALLVTGDARYLEMPRITMDAILSQGKRTDRGWVVPSRHDNSGWIGFSRMNDDYLSQLWFISLSAEDWQRIEKVRTAEGETAYAIPEFEPERKAPSDHLRRVMTEWVADVNHSGNLVVLRTPPGCAHVVASALDRSGTPSILGTVAGDDTILCVATEKVGGAKLAKQLRELAGR